jgi:hypothetical protein
MQIVLYLVVEQFNPKEPTGIKIGLFPEIYDNLHLPTTAVCDGKLLSDSLRLLLKNTIHIDPTWLDLDIVGSYSNIVNDSETCVFLIYKTRIPDNIDVHPALELIEYDKLAIVSRRISTDELRIIRRSFNS